MYNVITIADIRKCADAMETQRVNAAVEGIRLLKIRNIIKKWRYGSPNCYGKGMRMMRSNQTTLCYIEKDGKYLMMHRVKKEHDVNKDKWVGVGGHFEKDESPEECLLREVKEETGLTLTAWQLRGIITFICDKQQTEYMFLYTADAYFGELTECEEGELEWVEKSRVYDLPIWEGDKIFFRMLEENRPFFSLKLKYEKDMLVETSLNGK